ncbi:MAG TPA: tetratricopeptide repeat protein [bacterium]|nr:tetratricopeptide repeat protein [bacterium]
MDLKKTGIRVLAVSAALFLLVGCEDKNLRETNGQAVVALENGHPDEAIRLLQPLMDSTRVSPVVIVNLGHAYLETNDMEKGLQVLREAIPLVDENDPLIFLIARIFLVYGEVADVDEMMERCGSKLRRTAEYHLIRGNLLFDVGSEDADVLNEFREVLRIEPGNRDAVESFFRVIRRMTDLTNLDRILSELPEEALNSPGAKLAMARLSAQREEWEDCILYAEEATKLDREDEDAWRLLARAHQAMGDMQSAERTLRSAMSSFDRSPSIVLEYAKVLVERSKEDLAIRVLALVAQQQKQKPLPEQSPALHNFLAALYARKGQFSLAETELRTSLGIKPDQPQIREVLDLVAQRQQLNELESGS